MAGNIIPAIATTNAMTAGLCVLQAFKIMRDELQKAKMVFLVRSTERVLSSEALRPPNPACFSCGVATGHLVVDLSRATVENLVKDLLQDQLGYEEFSVVAGRGVIYDPDFEESLPMKLSEVGIRPLSFLEIIDEADEETRVNVLLNVFNQSIPETEKPVKLSEPLTIGTKPKKPIAPVPNGVPLFLTHNLTHNGKRKRGASETEVDDEIARKRGKVMEDSKAKPVADRDEIIILDDPNDGTILIDD